MRADANSSLSASTHAFDTVLKASYHASLSNMERVTNVFLNFVSTVQKETVFDFNCTTAFGGWAFAQFGIFVFDASPTALHLDDA